MPPPTPSPKRKEEKKDPSKLTEEINNYLDKLASNNIFPLVVEGRGGK